MVDLDTMNEMLDEIAGTIPDEIYRYLNGGIVLSKEYKMHPQAKAGDLYIMGEYHRSSMMGRYIIIYGGSFQKLYPNAGEARIKKELEKTLKHELTHHVESLAGEKDLEVEDAIKIEKYRRRRGG